MTLCFSVYVLWSILSYCCSELVQSSRYSTGSPGTTQILAIEPSSCVSIPDILQNHPLKSIPSYPVTVKVELHFEKIYSISLESTLDMVMYAESYWHDPRVATLLNQTYTDDLCLEDSAKMPIADVEGLIWQPRYNLFTSEFVMHQDSPYQSNFIIFKTDGSMVSYEKYEHIINCHVQLRKFPMDEPSCHFLISALEYDRRVIRLEWLNDSVPIKMLLGNKTAEYTVKSATMHKSTEQHGAIHADYLYVKIVFIRHMGWYIIHGYIPAYLIILVSCLYTILGVETRASRLQLRASLLLSLILMIYHMLRHMPRVGYVNALDTFTLMALGFLVLSSVEDTLIAYLCNKQMKIENARARARLPQASRYGGKFGRVPGSGGHHHTQGNPIDADGPPPPEPKPARGGRITPAKSPISPERWSVPGTTILLQYPKKAYKYYHSHPNYRELAQSIDNWWIIIYVVLWLLANMAYWYYYLRGKN